ncbi:hypothetical protein BC826DRAFT_1048252 [Russula brevipes]|nr:hypothetical protein BC826DRAFT_1048252 [Russula brevipes]
MMGACDALVPVLSVSKLSLECYPGNLQSPIFTDPHRRFGRPNALDSTTWHELLRPFNGVKRLCINNSFAMEISCALDADDAGLIPWLLPELQELEIGAGPSLAETAFAAFLNARQSVGRPVNLLPRLRLVSADVAVEDSTITTPPLPRGSPTPPASPLVTPPPFPLLSPPAQTNRLLALS